MNLIWYPIFQPHIAYGHASLPSIFLLWVCNNIYILMHKITDFVISIKYNFIKQIPRVFGVKWRHTSHILYQEEFLNLGSFSFNNGLITKCLKTKCDTIITPRLIWKMQLHCSFNQDISLIKEQSRHKVYQIFQMDFFQIFLYLHKHKIPYSSLSQSCKQVCIFVCLFCSLSNE